MFDRCVIILPPTRSAVVAGLLARLSSAQNEPMSCAADINLDETVSTEDLLYLLATFGRPAPADQCSDQATPLSPAPTPPPPAPDDPGLRDYLFCELRNRFQESVAAAAEAATVAAEAEAEAALAALTVQLAHAENALTTFHCGPIMLQNGVVAGDSRYGGEGITFSCDVGYEPHADVTLAMARTYACTQSGQYYALDPDTNLVDPNAPLTASLPRCELTNPCTANENDCDANAACAHTGAGTHSCTCLNDGDGVNDFFGTGDTCTTCGTCPFGFNLQEPCSSTEDVACVDPCASISCGDNGACSGGTCICSNDYTGTLCDIPPTPCLAVSVDMGNDVSRVETDFTNLAVPSDGPAPRTVTAQGGVSVTVGGQTHRRAYHDGNLDAAALIADNILCNAACTITMTIENLAPGEYDFTMWHNDHINHAGACFAITASTSAGYSVDQSVRSTGTTDINAVATTQWNPIVGDDGVLTVQLFQTGTQNPPNGNGITCPACQAGAQRCNSAGGHLALNGFTLTQTSGCWVGGR